MEPTNQTCVPSQPTSFEEKKAVLLDRLALTQEQSARILEQLKESKTASDDESLQALAKRRQVFQKRLDKINRPEPAGEVELLAQRRRAFRDNVAAFISSEDGTSSSSDSEEPPVLQSGVLEQDIERYEQINAQTIERSNQIIADAEASQRTIQLAQEGLKQDPISLLSTLTEKMGKIQEIVKEEQKQFEKIAQKSEMIDNLLKKKSTGLSRFKEVSHELFNAGHSKINQFAHQALSGLNTTYRAAKEKMQNAWEYITLSRNKLVHGLALGILAYGSVKTMPPQLTFVMSTAGLIYLLVKPKLF